MDYERIIFAPTTQGSVLILNIFEAELGAPRSLVLGLNHVARWRPKHKFTFSSGQQRTVGWAQRSILALAGCLVMIRAMC